MSSEIIERNVDSDIVIQVEGVNKCYQIYDKPHHRLLQGLYRGKRNFFREFQALSDISFNIKKGETLGIIGENGAGKSTLLQIICGTLSQTSGNIQTNGRVAALLELGAGFNPEFTGRENVFMYGAILGLERRELEEKYDAIVDFADIGEFIDQPVKTYSSGMYVRLAFAVIAHVDADILVIDEALAVGDAVFIQKCMKFIRAFKEKGTLIFVSHNSQAVLDFCDEAIWLTDGFIKERGKAKDVCRSYAVFVHGKITGSSDILIDHGTEGSSKSNKHIDQTPEIERQNFDSDFQRSPDSSNLLELFEFNWKSPWFGEKGAEIHDVSIEDNQGNKVSTIKGGETVTIKIKGVANQIIAEPVVGFIVRNPHGLELFGENTFATYKDRALPELVEGDTFCSKFKVIFPYLPAGDYSICVAIANGNPHSYVQQHWIDEAIIFKVVASHVTVGVIGVPLLLCNIKVNDK